MDFEYGHFMKMEYRPFVDAFFLQVVIQFIPYSFIEKEASRAEGFSPELALVTIGRTHCVHALQLFATVAFTCIYSYIDPGL